MLAVGETKFFGEPVAAIAAETEDAARAAAAAVRVDYEELPAVITVQQALDPAAPLVQDPAIRVEKDLSHTNVLQEWRFGWGMWGSGPIASSRTTTRSRWSRTSRSEPHAFLAAPDAEGVTIWSAIQHPYVLQRVVASALGWPVAKVRIISPDPGRLRRQRLAEVRAAARVPRAPDRPARSSRADARGDLSAGPTRVCEDPRPDGVRQVRAHRVSGHPGRLPDWRVRRRRRPRGQQGELRGVRTLSNAERARDGARAAVAHDAEHRVSGFGTPQASWAVESQLNAAASALGIDRLEIRRRNVAKRGEAFIPGDTPADGDWEGVREQSRQRESAGPILWRPGVAGAFRSASRALRRRRLRMRSLACTTTGALRSCRARRTWARARERC